MRERPDPELRPAFPMWSRTSAITAFVLFFVLSFAVFHHHFQPDVTEHTWVQHMFQIMTLLIFIPSTLYVFNWIASLWQDTSNKKRRT